MKMNSRSVFVHSHMRTYFVSRLSIHNFRKQLAEMGFFWPKTKWNVYKV